MEVVPGLHLIDDVASAGVNVYVWERSDGGLTLIDAGLPTSAGPILSYLNRLGRARLDRILITHGDIDHIGALAHVRAATEAKVICHAAEKDVVEGRSRRRPKPSLARWLYLPLLLLVEKVIWRYPSVRVDELVLDQQRLPEGFRVVHVPGHTAGQIALHEPERGILIVGDAMRHQAGRLVRPVGLFTPRMDIAEDSIRKLARLDNLRVVCFGHGLPIMDQASERLRAFADSLASSKHCPENSEQ